MKTSTTIEPILKRIAHEPDFRRKMCLESHYWFFHTYFPHLIKYPCAQMHKEMLYYAGIKHFRRLLVMGFPRCGKTLIHSFSFPLWSLLRGDHHHIVILVGEEEKKTFRDRLEEVICNNKQLRKDFSWEVQRKGYRFLWSNQQATISIGSLEEDIDTKVSWGLSPDLIIVDPISPFPLSKSDTDYDRLKNILDYGGDAVRKIIVGRGGGRSGALNRTYRDMILDPSLGSVPSLYPFFRLNSEKAAWPEKFSTQASILMELGKGQTLEKTCFEYLILNDMPDVQFQISEDNVDDAYAILGQEGNVIPQDLDAIDAIFLTAYQSDTDRGTMLSGVKIKQNRRTVWLYQNVEWMGVFDEAALISKLSSLRKNFDSMGLQDFHLMIYGDKQNDFSQKVCQLIQDRPGFGYCCNEQRETEAKRSALKDAINEGVVRFSKRLARKLNEDFREGSPAKNNCWVENLSLVLPETYKSTIILHHKY